MLHIIRSYIHFLWHSKNEHGVHSPFVFDLVTKCFYDKKYYPEYKTLQQHRRLLLSNQSLIEVTDFGAGSKVFKSNLRAINKIAKNAGISPKRAQLLYRIVRYFQPKNILEIGTSVGLATPALALGNTNCNVITLEGCPNTSEVATNYFEKMDWHNIQVETTEFSDYLKKSEVTASKFDLIYFDGNHSKKATLEYFEQLLTTVTNETLWIFDDIHWSPDMEEAWETIKSHPKVTVTIDTFQWGLVFFRKEQEKEHFIIRT